MRTGGRGRGGRTPDQQAALERGETTYKELCASCHGADGRGMPLEGASAAMLAPPLIGSPRVLGHREYAIKTILHGLTGPVNGRTYGVMVPMGANRDDWIADVSSYIRNAFGNSATLVTPADVARVRAATERRTTPWTVAELEGSVPVALVPEAGWKATASHASDAAAGGLTYEGWTAPAPQQPGMWFQVELPTPVTLAEVEFTSPPQGGGRAGPQVGTFPRGYTVETSADGKQWDAPIARGAGSGTTTSIAFPPVRTRFLRITQTGTGEGNAPWTIQRLRLYRAADKPAGTQ
jgi:mono/diheme cytochrome c family protein